MKKAFVMELMFSIIVAVRRIGKKTLKQADKKDQV